jgi:DNA-binding MarR family transcriptional regulator
MRVSMNTKENAGLDLFVSMWSTWLSRIPSGLSRQEPTVLTRLLALGLREQGISQSDLRRELGMNQPRLSKLMQKLLGAGWIRIRTSKTDSRVKLMTTTAAARDRIAVLKADLAALLPAKGAEQALAPLRKSKPSSSVRRRIEQQQASQGFNFEELESGGVGSQDE